MNIRLKEREEKLLSDLEVKTTFKIPESSFVYMKMAVENMTFHTDIAKSEVPGITKVGIPEGKTPVVCLDTGKAQFLALKEKVEIVVLDVNEIIEEKGE